MSYLSMIHRPMSASAIFAETLFRPIGYGNSERLQLAHQNLQNFRRIQQSGEPM